MSLNQILDNPAGTRPLPWTNLNVNSIKAKSITSDTPAAESRENVYVSSSGDDANDGLTSGTPVLTISRAVEVASGSSGQHLIINCSGGGAISGFISCDIDVFGVTKLLDLSRLSGNYNAISIRGSRQDELVVPAGTTTRAANGPGDRWSRLSGLTGLTPSLYTRGHIEGTGDTRLMSYANDATTIDIIGRNGNLLDAFGFSIYNLDGTNIFDNSAWGILSDIPVSFEDIEVKSATGSFTIRNLCSHRLRFKNCKLNVQTVDEQMITGGSFELIGCELYGGASTDEVFDDADTEYISITNSQMNNCRQLLNNLEEFVDVYSVNCQLAPRQANCRVTGWLSSHDALSNIDGFGGNMFLDSCNLSNSSSANISVEGMQINSSNLTLSNTAAGAEPCVYLTSCSWDHLGDNNFSSTNGSCVLLDNSKFNLRPSQGATPVNIFDAASTCIFADECSHVVLGAQENKTLYRLGSSVSDEAIILDNGSRAVLPVLTKGPDIFTVLLTAMASVQYDSTLILGGNYSNPGDGEDVVILGDNVIVNVAAFSGAAVDVIPEVGTIGTDPGNESRNAHVIVK
jgi:hypothetical protein